MLYYQLEPFGNEANYVGHAITASTVYNMLRDPKKSKAAKPEDFMPKFEDAVKEIKQKSSKEIYDMFKTWAIWAGAKKENHEMKSGLGSDHRTSEPRPDKEKNKQ